MEEICLKSENLVEVPDSVLKSSCQILNLDFNDIVTIPSELCENLLDLVSLSINGNMLKTLPVNIGLLTQLTELYLKENDLIELPESFAHLKHLRKLHVTGNKLKTFPRYLHSLDSLTELIADENNIESLPNTFGELKCLSHLSLSYNSIECLPDNFGNLYNLKELDLSNNNLKNLPESFQCLPSLEVLDLTNNKIYSLPRICQSSRTLKKLLMSQNDISSIPAWFSELESIKEIHLSDNYLNEMPFPDNFGDGCNNLELVDLSGNNIKGLPESFGKLKKLSFLDLGSSFDELERNRMVSNGNEIEHLPITFCHLKNLTKLELDENQLCQLPEEFGLLESLTYLDLSHNILKFLPESFGQLQQLKVCMLSMNFITHLPTSFGMLKSIEDLKLDNNMIEYLPESFENLSTLVSLDLYNNSLKEPPTAVKKLKCLKHLDLRENDFGRTLEELLAISYEPTYPVRNPELQNNWRGRKRPDIQPSSWVEKKDGVQNTENLENDFLYNAMISASALWRRHGQTDNRSKMPSVSITNGVAETESNSDLPVPSTNPEIENVAEDNECWDDDIQSLSSETSSLSSHESINFQAEVPSDWETDSDFEVPNNFKKIYKHPTDDESSKVNRLFVPSDLHVKRVGLPEVWHLIEDGQFDDADL
ncbi:Leucine-rich repeat-containing protein 7 [Araneus ventricosus]|uniref:Leucine-rich repeat-containing protein 7 n=1 Tax=Araneus ventricosus TaxID=182803 RepID=A0A4Y2MCC8_ARAVE|nr:Leucine-rich repeat-containing protein 7 [Araneus ventricosus]